MDSHIFERHPCPMWVFDRAGHRFRAVNPSAVEQYGYSRTEFLDMTIRDIRTAEQFDAVERYFEGGGRPVEGPPPVWDHETKYGRRKHVHLWPVPLDWGGRPSWLVTVVDVTAQVRAEAELATQKRRLADAVAAGKLTAWDHDYGGGSAFFADGYNAFFGLPPGPPPVTWEECRSIIHPDDEAHVRRVIEAVLASGGPFEVAFRGPPGPGRQRHFIASGRVEVGPDGRFTRKLGVTRDVTDEVEAAARAAAAEARLTLADRHRAAAQAVGGVAHDFNNLLTAVLGFVELAQMSQPAKPVSDHLRMAHTAAGRAAELCRQLLHVAGRAKPSGGAFDLAGVVRETAGLLRAAVDRRVALDVSAERLPPLAGDDGAVRQAVLNLVKNAADAIPGVGAVTVRTGRREVSAGELAGAAVGAGRAGGWYQWVSVADTGCGVPAEVLPRLFDPYFTTKADGHGLGLAVVRGAAEAHAGAVLVRSEVGKGTTVELLLPENGS